jgi:transglutaminase-like putative cysteine protease
MRYAIGRKYHYEIEDTEHGLDRKLTIIRDLIMQSRHDGLTGDVAHRITYTYTDDASRISAVYYWVRDNMRFVPDSGADDVFVSSHRQIGRIMHTGEGYGDCDDYTILTGSLLHNIGIPIRPVVVSAVHEGSGDWNHVYIEALDRGSGTWVILDPVRKNRGIGRTSPYTKRRVYPVIQ